MTTRRRIVEWSKNILIVLLACSAVTLAVMASADDVSGGTTLLGRLSAWLGTGETPDAARADAHVQAAALPVAVSVQSQAGRYSALYDTAALSDAYARFGGLLGQALESAGSAQPSAMSAVREALMQQSVYFAYPGAVPLAALAGWLDATYEGDDRAAWFVLSVRSDAVLLYFGQDDEAFVCKTYLQAERLSRETARSRPDGTAFAFEQAELSSLEPLTLLDLSGAWPVRAISAESAWSDSFVSDTASGLGFNPYGDGYYTDADGTLVFSESGCTLRIGTDGRIRLSNQLPDDPRFAGEGEDLCAQIETARALLAHLTDGRTGEAALYLTDADDDGGIKRLTFEYFVGGIPVELPDGPAAAVTLTGGTVTELSVRVRAYAAGAAAESLLPVRQAAALTKTGRLRVGYADSGDPTPDVGWMD